jgi:hypothetical protein
MSWLYSQALVEEYSGDTSSDGEQSVQLSGNPTQQAYLSPDKMTEYSRLSRFGMMFKPLTEGRGKALLMLYLAAFPAKTSLPQEKAQGLTESDQECGEKWRGSFTKYDPDSSSWKTHQCSLLGDLDEFSETWPRWGLMRDGECWEQQMSAHRTNETESGFVPDGETFFHTPNTTGMDGGSNSRKALKKRQESWPTPCATDYKGSGKTGELRDRLDYAVERGATKSKTYTWPTPRTKGMCGGTGSWELLKKNTTIEEARQMGAGNGGKLNPTWVEWLMGWPLGWTDLKPLEMDKFQKWLEQHGRD